MRHPSFLLPLLPLALSVAGALWACGGSSSTTTSSSSSGSGGSGGGGSGGSTGSTPFPDAGAKVHCTLDNGSDPVAFCAQKLVLLGEHKAAFDAKRGLAQSWDSTTQKPDTDPSSTVLHSPRDDAAYAAAVSRYHQSAERYGDDEITATLDADLVALVPTLVAELTPPPSGYSGDLYFDLRTAAGGLRFLQHNDLAAMIDVLADAYGRAIYDASYAPLAAGDGGAKDAVLGTPAAGGATAYAPADVATGALALIDLAVRHATDDPAHAASWQDAAASALSHLDARARDAKTGLYFAALVTSADPVHDALAPGGPSGPPADALLTQVAGGVSLALLRAQELALAHPTALPAVAALPLEARGEALLLALDGTSKPLWDSIGGGYYEGWVPSSAQRLEDKPTRANALLLAALHRATALGSGPDATRVKPLRAALAAHTMPHVSLLSVVNNQNGYFRRVPSGFNFALADAGADPREKSYFSSANTVAVEGLSELWLGIPN